MVVRLSIVNHAVSHELSNQVRTPNRAPSSAYDLGGHTSVSIALGMKVDMTSLVAGVRYVKELTLLARIADGLRQKISLVPRLTAAVTAAWR